LAPISQYGKDKALAHEFLQDHSSQSIEIKRAILFNHESEYRKSTFVSQKIAIEAAKYRLGRRHELLLGNVHSARDWGYAPDYMEALSLMLEREGNETYVVASGELHTIQELIQIAFGVTKDFDQTTLYSTDPGLLRKNETKPLAGSSNRLVTNCGWKPTVRFEGMIERMVHFQMANMK
jgi:GDPmannose 4,6-dehydratase